MTALAIWTACAVLAPSVADAEPTSPRPPVASITDSARQDGQEVVTLRVPSPSMGRLIPVVVRIPRDQSSPSPVLYLLNGAGGEDSPSRKSRAAFNSYFADRKVYVVIPMEGANSYYTDWRHDDPVLGRNKWQTFLTRELPPVIDAMFDTNGRNAAAGISMSGTSVFNLAIAAPGLYRAVAAYSGCARTSDPLGEQYVRLVVEGRGGANPVNMWGPPSGRGWRDNDPYLQARKLRGTQIVMTSGSGLPGRHERLDDPMINGNGIKLGDQVITGGVIEAAVDACTRDMAKRLSDLSIPASVILRPRGSHSWGYWRDDLAATWPQIERTLYSETR